MGIVDDLQAGFGVMLRPTENTKKTMDIGKAFGWYFRVTFIPLIALIIVSLALVGALAASPVFGVFGSTFATIGIVAAIIVPLVFLWALIPVTIFISAGLYHLVGTWTKTFKGDFNKTFTATMFSKLPTMIFLWVLLIPATSAFYVIFVVWELIVLLLALSNQQKIKWNVALGTVIITDVIVTAVLALLLTLFGIAINGAIAGAVLPHILGNNGYSNPILPFSGSAP